MSPTVKHEKEWFNRDILLTKELLTAPSSISADEEFYSTPDPVAWLIRRGAARDPDSFYTKLAKLLDLPFQESIPLSINPIGAAVPRLSLEVMAQELVLHQQVDDTHVLYVANPCIPKSKLAELLAQIGSKCKVLLSSHGEIKHALTYLNAYSSFAQAESLLTFARPDLASRAVLRRINGWLVLLGFAVFAAVVLRYPVVGFGVFVGVNFFYFILNPLKVVLHFAGQRQVKAIQDSTETREIPTAELPYYTVIVPLKNESVVIPQLLTALRSLQYPPEKLDIKLAVEADDTVTLDALAAQQISESQRHRATPENILFHLVKVPPAAVSTKPRSCNFALQLARGVVTVIYDAEDKPEPLQLIKAWNALMTQKLNTLCAQAQLTYYNQNQNLLTRFFTLEYGFWFSSFLPGLQALNIPFPLGGTSNHFITQSLKKIGGWDAHNVTEDADLGWRLNRFNFETVMIDSLTYEEAMSTIWGWIKQRTRWQKGFITTVLVHGSQLGQLTQDLGFVRMLTSLTMFSSVVLLPLINPLLWILFIAGIGIWLFDPGLAVELPTWIWSIAVTNLIFGNLSYIAMHILVVWRQRWWSLLPQALLLPLYWPLLSIATYRAVWQLCIAPEYWEKTEHGLS